jgi:penicillin-binding protein 1A
VPATPLNDDDHHSVRTPHARRIARCRRRAAHRRAWHVVLAATVAALLGVAGATAGALLVATHDVTGLPGCRLDAMHPRVIGRDSLVLARDGSLLGAVPTTHNREPVPLGRVSPWLQRATVAIEDRRFWEHGALDYEAMLRAAVADLRAGRAVQGASTITQQLVRDRYLSGKRMTLVRKLHEACLAVALWDTWPRRRILGSYLNLVFYGHHAYGAEAAARTYFATTARGLTLTQAAMLAGLPQAPSIYDPFVDPRAARTRRNDVLRAMRTAHMIGARRYRAAVAAPLVLRPGHRYQRIVARPFFDDVLRGLMARYGKRHARHGGLRVRTTLDPHLQALARHAIAGWLRSPSDPAAALVAIDPRTGAIRAMASLVPHGRLQFGLGSQAHRQAGSLFKVFTLTAAIERGIPLSSIWNGPPSLTIHSRRCLNATGAWLVHNYADEKAGTMTLASAIAHSVNTIFAQVVMKVGPARVVEIAHRMGVRSPLVPVCSITLGPEGVTPVDLATAFATLADRGVRHAAHEVQEVTGPGGELVARVRPAGVRALAPRVAAQVTSALRGVVQAGTGVAADIGRPVAGKTGTAESFKDAWFCGFARQLSACVWLGYPRAEIPMHGVEGFDQVVGGSVPARIWHDFMGPALRDTKQLPLPAAPAALGRTPRP